MSPCSANDVSIKGPLGPSGPAIAGFGIPFSLPLPTKSPFPAGFPEDLLSLLNTYQFLIPPGVLKPTLNPNFSKDIFDTIMSLLDQFMPFLMLYKFFLPLLNMIICIIEVLCALMNPFALVGALNRLFNQCIPQFLNMFPIFALIIMIISLLLLILALIEYIAAQILKIVQALLRNIAALNNAFQNGDSSGVLAIAQKLGALLCIFQNLFVLFAIFNIIFDIIKDILSMGFAIPPCQSGGSGDANSCCTPNTCPAIVQTTYTNATGTFRYFPQVSALISGFTSLGITIRNEEWQLYDLSQTQAEAFSNIYNAYDITTAPPKPVFFPTDSTYTATTSPAQAPYQIDIDIFYNPANWGRKGIARYVQFKNCIMQQVPSPNLLNYDNSTSGVNTGVAVLVGGAGYEANGTTVLNGFASDGVTPINSQATLENFLHIPTVFVSSDTSPLPNDGYTFVDIQYTFRPNLPPLIQKDLVTLGCEPSVALNRGFVNSVLASNVGLKTQQLANLVLPDTNAAQQCMLTAVAALRSNMTNEGVAEFQATSTACLNTLQNATNTALNDLINLGVDPCSSSFTLTPPVQFTSDVISLAVSLNETNGLPLTIGLSPAVAANLAQQLSAHVSFGTVSNFAYDGYQYFIATISSTTTGIGQVSVSFDNNVFCTNTFVINETPTHTLQSETYQFIYTPPSKTPDGDTSDGTPRRDASDIARGAS